MPKNISRTKTTNGRIIISRPCSKFRIGSRKSGKSALLMSTDELIAVLENKSKKRYHRNALTVLSKRNDEKAKDAVDAFLKSKEVPLPVN